MLLFRIIQIPEYGIHPAKSRKGSTPKNFSKRVTLCALPKPEPVGDDLQSQLYTLGNLSLDSNAWEIVNFNIVYLGYITRGTRREILRKRPKNNNKAWIQLFNLFGRLLGENVSVPPSQQEWLRRSRPARELSQEDLYPGHYCLIWVWS